MISTVTPRQVVLNFWQAMQSNDFEKVGQWLSDDFVCEWQQTNERIVGRRNFIAINSTYPTVGNWQFVINRVIVEGKDCHSNKNGVQVVTEVDVTDGKTNARAITFHTVTQGKINHQVEYWLDSFHIGMDIAPEWRNPWVKSISV